VTLEFRIGVIAAAKVAAVWRQGAASGAAPMNGAALLEGRR